MLHPDHLHGMLSYLTRNCIPSYLCRIKSRPEYRSAFISPEVFHRALHILSTQHYRLPVRRYIMDLFNLEINPDLVATLNQCAVSLKASPSQKFVKPDVTRQSMFGRLGRSRRPSQSDDSDEDDGLDASMNNHHHHHHEEDHPIISLQPLSRIIGFAI